MLTDSWKQLKVHLGCDLIYDLFSLWTVVGVMISLAASVTGTEVTLATRLTSDERAVLFGNCKMEECNEVTLQLFPRL